MGVVEGGAIGPRVDRHVGGVQEVVGEILLDHVALVAEADDEIVDAVMGVDLHDVPEDRLAADLDHRLRPQVGFLGDAGAQAAREDDRFHAAARFACFRGGLASYLGARKGGVTFSPERPGGGRRRPRMCRWFRLRSVSRFMMAPTCSTRSLACLARQTFRDFEVLIFDNASTDATAEIAAAWVARDPQFHYLRQPNNVGALANFRDVLLAAKSPWFMWRADDDLSADDYIETLHSLATSSPGCRLAVSTIRSCDLDGGRLRVHFCAPRSATRARRPDDCGRFSAATIAGSTAFGIARRL